jgi:hypothetical protein
MRTGWRYAGTSGARLVCAATAVLCALTGVQACAASSDGGGASAPPAPNRFEGAIFPCPNKDTPKVAPSFSNNVSNAELRTAVVCAVNKYRCDQAPDLTPLTTSDLPRPPTSSSCRPDGYSLTLGHFSDAASPSQSKLWRAAQYKAQMILDCRSYDHNPCRDKYGPGVLAGRPTPYKFLDDLFNYPCRKIAENLDMSWGSRQSTAQKVADGWFHSTAGEKENMLDADLYETGVGLASADLPRNILIDNFGIKPSELTPSVDHARINIWVQLYGAQKPQPGCRVQPQP